MTTSASLYEGPIFYFMFLLYAFILCLSQGDLHLSLFHFILWQAPCVWKVVIYMSNWMFVSMGYYC